jgi:glutamate N-acetyltransferase/amino-acid N-acetyltransferase
MSHNVPAGFTLAGLHCGIKRNPAKHDLALIVCDGPTVAAGTYTTNKVFAAPVAWDRAHTPSDHIRVLAINSGNANACTGERGDEDCRMMAEAAAAACGATANDALLLSTGIIGEFLPLAKITAGIARAAGKLGRNDASLVAAARGMMTTDTVHKLASRKVDAGGASLQLTGMAKGAAMIGPKMATMLGVVMTDARLTPDVAQAVLRTAVQDSFNCISVDGHMSTNDTVLLLASGAASDTPLAGDDLAAFQAALDEVCRELARAIPSDGEGATHLVTVDATGCPDHATAHEIAKTVAESALVKTAVAGADPNWGRIVSAAGYAGVDFDPNRCTLHVNSHLLYQHAAPVEFDKSEVSASIRNNRDTSIVLDCGAGESSCRFWTTDLTPEYVRLNADYHT